MSFLLVIILKKRDRANKKRTRHCYILRFKPFYFDRCHGLKVDRQLLRNRRIRRRHSNICCTFFCFCTEANNSFPSRSRNIYKQMTHDLALWLLGRVYTYCLHVLFTRIVYTYCLHVLFTRIVYTYCLHVLFTRIVYTYCLQL